MTDHVFGTIAGDNDIGGVFALGDAVLLNDWITLAVETINGTERTPCIVMELHGRVNKSQDTLRANYVIPLIDAGSLAGALFHAAQRLGRDEEIADFTLGFNLGATGKRLDSDDPKDEEGESSDG